MNETFFAMLLQSILYILYVYTVQYTHFKAEHEAAWYSALLILYTYIYNIYIQLYIHDSVSFYCVCMLNQQHYRRRVCWLVFFLLCVIPLLLLSARIFTGTYVSTRLRHFFKLSFILWPFFIVVVAICLPHLLLHWPYIGANVHENTKTRTKHTHTLHIYRNAYTHVMLAGYLLLLDLVFQVSVFFRPHLY